MSELYVLEIHQKNGWRLVLWSDGKMYLSGCFKRRKFEMHAIQYGDSLWLDSHLPKYVKEMVWGMHDAHRAECRQALRHRASAYRMRKSAPARAEVSFSGYDWAEAAGLYYVPFSKRGIPTK